MSKSEGQTFHSITELGKKLDLPTHVLRFWETKFKEISPVKRAGGRRYYRAEDVALISQIKDLLYRQGYTIKGVQGLLKQGKRGNSIDSVENSSYDEVKNKQEETASLNTSLYKENLSHLLEELKSLRTMLETTPL